MHGGEDCKCDYGEPLKDARIAEQVAMAADDQNLQRSSQEALKVCGVEEGLENGACGSSPLVLP